MDWGIVFLATEGGEVPADDLLNSCPASVHATMLATLEAVREAPPPAFSGGGKWEAMHGAMDGYYELRVTGPGRRHYRLFGDGAASDRHAIAAGGRIRGVYGPKAARGGLT